jgi:diguanylate cyclase (GGDEF)-like protein
VFPGHPAICDPAICDEVGGTRDGGCGASHLRAALHGLPVGVLTFDRALVVRFASTRLAAMLEIRPAAMDHAVAVLDLLEGSAVLDQAAVRHVHAICLAAVDVADTHRSTFPVAAGTQALVLALHVAPLGDGHWMATVEEAAARAAAPTGASEQSTLDPLTGLANRQRFFDHVVATLAEPAPSLTGAGEVGEQPVESAVFLIDLDRFKAVNDTLGHPVGDALLRLVGKRLQSVLRDHDMVARLGADEFALLLSPAAGPARMAQLARRIVDVLGRPYLIDGQLVNIGASVGVALAPQDGPGHDRLLRNAELALHHAKRAGRGTYSFFEREMDTRALTRRTLEIDLRKALSLREFELHYQPQIDLESGAVVGFEALVRWRHPERGLVSPADFIPVAEEIGLIAPLGEWVLREACEEARRWPDGVSVAVNISPHQFEDTDRLVAVIARSLAASGLPGGRLEIEITESVLLRNETAVLAALHQVRAMGVRVAMDDFGTGYSSLSQLHSFPFDKIKIDRSFVTDRGDPAGQNAIIRAITALGVSLGMSTIAEGVETSEQLDRIRAEGCTSVQGYLYSRPVPVEQVAALIARYACDATTASIPAT